MDVRNSSPPSTAYMHQCTVSALVQIMLGVKPLPVTRLSYCKLDLREQTSVKFESKYKTFHSIKRHLNISAKWRPYFPGEMIKLSFVINHYTTPPPPPPPPPNSPPFTHTHPTPTPHTHPHLNENELTQRLMAFNGFHFNHYHYMKVNIKTVRFSVYLEFVYTSKRTAYNSYTLYTIAIYSNLNIYIDCSFVFSYYILLFTWQKLSAWHLLECVSKTEFILLAPKYPARYFKCCLCSNDGNTKQTP